MFHAPPNKDEGGSINFEAFNSKEFNIKKLLIQKLDSSSKLIIFNQDIEDNGHFKYKTVDCLRKFEEREITVQHPAFTRFATVR